MLNLFAQIISRNNKVSKISKYTCFILNSDQIIKIPVNNILQVGFNRHVFGCLYEEVSDSELLNSSSRSKRYIFSTNIDNCVTNTIPLNDELVRTIQIVGGKEKRQIHTSIGTVPINDMYFLTEDNKLYMLSETLNEIKFPISNYQINRIKFGLDTLFILMDNGNVYTLDSNSQIKHISISHIVDVVTSSSRIFYINKDGLVYGNSTDVKNPILCNGLPPIVQLIIQDDQCIILSKTGIIYKISLYSNYINPFGGDINN
jgi:alpha-tubulin suppressor-like RCC1 family protein